MSRYRTSIHSSARPSSAFDALSRFDRAEEWDPGVEKGSMLTAEPVRVGSRFRLVTRFAGRAVPLEYEVVECRAPDRIVFRAETGFLRSIDTISFAADPTGTVVVYDAVLDTKGIARLATPFLALAFRRIGDRAAAGLRAYLNAVPTS